MARKNDTQRIPRPPNAFILYRSYMTGKLPPPSPGTYRKQGDVSRIISELWHNEPQEVKAEYHQLALIKKLEHEAKYPGYKYSPRSKEQRERERRARSNETNSSVSAVQADFHDAFSATDYLSTFLSASTVPSKAFEMTPTAWSQQDFEEVLKALHENLGDSNYRFPGTYTASYGSDVRSANAFSHTNQSAPSQWQDYGQYVPLTSEASLHSMLEELTGGQINHSHSVYPL